MPCSIPIKEVNMPVRLKYNRFVLSKGIFAGVFIIFCLFSFFALVGWLLDSSAISFLIM